MRYGSVNVMYITLGDFTLPSHFCELIEAFTVVLGQRPVAFDSP
jgi:hypothetical protein